MYSTNNYHVNPKNGLCMPDGVQQFMNIDEGLNRLKIDYNRDKILLQYLEEIRKEVRLGLEILNYVNRLPLYKIEKKVEELCKEDPQMQGILLQIEFQRKFGQIDYSKLGNLILKV